MTCLKLERACSCHCWQNAAEKILATSPVGCQMKQLLEESVRWRWWRSWWWLWPDGGRRVGDVCNGIGGKKQPGHPRCTFLEQPPTNPCCCTTCSCSSNKPCKNPAAASFVTTSAVLSHLALWWTPATAAPLVPPPTLALAATSFFSNKTILWEQHQPIIIASQNADVVLLKPRACLWPLRRNKGLSLIDFSYRKLCKPVQDCSSLGSTLFGLTVGRVGRVSYEDSRSQPAENPERPPSEARICQKFARLLPIPDKSRIGGFNTGTFCVCALAAVFSAVIMWRREFTCAVENKCKRGEASAGQWRLGQ